ncbi:hypothetical protein IGI04_036018 [Brassica rapa subsp. trilocularis]|uniref:Retrotransposon Copia-like N-terminal domain-containing protein n=1 Tax=Brassica rapa subsp. trilocularis TaxID=1813537 RepID=A0ABQ7LDE2_BRACM|nr:hypothetical protein IGI04_036018 [Brassica rapa subsp. trilocularis]
MEKLREFGCEWYGRPYKAVHGRTVHSRLVCTRSKIQVLSQAKMEHGMNMRMKVAVTFKGSNYLVWSRMVKTAVGSKGLWGQITTGEAPKLITQGGDQEEVSNEAAVEKWQQEDMLVMTVLHASLDPAILDAYSYCELRKLPWITLVRRNTPKRDQDKGGAVWIRSGHSWKGKATLQPVQACEASQQPASLDFTCFQSHFEIPFSQVAQRGECVCL